jgi:hypothetical protein
LLVNPSTVVCAPRGFAGIRSLAAENSLQPLRHCRMLLWMHTVVETPEYLRDVKRAGLS